MLDTLQKGEVGEEKFYEMLECLPPERMASGAFLVGEPADHNRRGEARFDLYYQKDRRYFYGGLMTLKEFDAQFSVQKKISRIEELKASEEEV